MLVSIIIPAYNAEATLALCLKACLDQSYPDTEVILIDDGSTDATPRIAQSFAVHYAHQENAGPAVARNHGAQVAKGEIIVYTDSDCVPETGWIDALVTEFEDGVTAVGGTYGIANPDSPLARIVHEEIRLRHARFEKEVDFLGSFNVAYRKKDFDALGGFDESFRKASGEDNDLAYRLHDAGGSLVFSPNARVAHHHPTRLLPYLRTQMGHGYWRMKLYAKHPGRAQSGDKYANKLDLAAPPLALLLMLSLLTLSLAFVLPAAATLILLVPLMLTSLLALLHLPKMLTMLQHSKDPSMLLFLPLAMLRDMARALGMVHGVIRFMILKKGTTR